MNEYEVEAALFRYVGHPILGPATSTLSNLVDWTNSNSDGWPYWSKPCRAAKQLQELIQGNRLASLRFDRERADVTVADYKAALKPIKSFRTRQNADFKIVEV